MLHFERYEERICKNNKVSFVLKLTLLGGADGRIRTGDLILTKDALYLLSYSSVSSVKDA